MVSVIIPAHNKADLTVSAVESVLSQTYPDIECIVVDDGSTDATLHLLTPYIKKCQIGYYWQANRGASAGRNRGIHNARGEYLAFLDCDDEYSYTNAIKDMVEFLEKNNYGMIHGNAMVPCVQYLKGDSEGPYADVPGGRDYHIKPPRGRLLFNNYICNSTTLTKKRCLDKVGLFDENLFIAADWDMWLRIEEYFKIGYLHEYLVKRT